MGHYEPKEQVPIEQGEQSLQLYRDAQQAQLSGDHWKAVVLFGLSMNVGPTQIHPNSMYQICWSLACLREWDLCDVSLKVLLSHYPLHDAGNHLSETLRLIAAQKDTPGVNERFADLEFGSPKELRRLVEEAM